MLLGWAATTAAALAVGSSARAAFVQFAIPADADVVAESSAAAPFGIDNGGQAFLSATQAAARAAVGQTANGLPDNGQFLDASNNVIQLLPYTGNNVVRRNAANTAAFTVNVTPNVYQSLTIFATSGDAPSTITLGLNYSNGTVTVPGVPVPDWFSDVGDAGFPAGEGYLVNGLDRTLTAGAGFEDSNDPAIFAIPIQSPTLDPSRLLNSITITRTSTTGTLNVFGVTGNTVPEPASAGLLGLGAVGLLARRRRRRRRA